MQISNSQVYKHEFVSNLKSSASWTLVLGENLPVRARDDNYFLLPVLLFASRIPRGPWILVVNEEISLAVDYGCVLCFYHLPFFVLPECLRPSKVQADSTRYY